MSAGYREGLMYSMRSFASLQRAGTGQAYLLRLWILSEEKGTVRLSSFCFDAPGMCLTHLKMNLM